MDAKSVKVSDLMNRKIRFIDKNKSIIRAGKQMIEEGISSFIIKPDEQYDAYGIITRKDIVGALINNSIGEVSILVKDIMTKPVITINPDMSVFICHQMMLMVGVRRLPVVEGNNPVGIISNSDILKYILS